MLFNDDPSLRIIGVVWSRTSEELMLTMGACQKRTYLNWDSPDCIPRALPLS